MGLGPESGMRSLCAAGTEFLEEEEKFWKMDSGGSCTAMCMCLPPLNVHWNRLKW